MVEENAGSEPPPTSTPRRRKWTVQQIRDLGQRKMGKRGCWAQIQIALAVYEGKDVVGVAPTGFGKTFAFFLALFMALEDGLDSMITVVTPLNLLGKQNATVLNANGLTAVAVNAENSSPQVYDEIRQGKYRVVAISPELVKDESFLKLMEDRTFQSRQLYVVIDEAHCVSKWGRSFREDYLDVGNLRDFLPDDIPFCVVSATLAPPVLRDVSSLLQLRASRTEHIILSNDRPNVHLLVHELQHSLTSYRDLTFLIPKDLDTPPEKFLIFFDSIREAEDAVEYLQSLLPEHLRGKIAWFHATMSDPFRDDKFEALRRGDLWGLAVTDAFGMGMDLSDIKLVIQWRVPKDMDTLWQRFGRAGRDLFSAAIAILMADKADFDAAREKKAQAAEKAALTRATKRKALDDGNMAPSKRQALGDSNGAHIELTTAAPSSLSPPASLPAPSSASPFTPSPTSNSALCRSKEQRRLFYHSEKLVTGSRNAKREAVVIGCAMDDMVNAANPERSINCRREPPMVYFGNDMIKTDYHLKCDPASPNGCERCRPRKSDICCDLCSPTEFTDLIQRILALPEPDAAAKSAGKSRLKDFVADSKDYELKTALYDWGERVASDVLDPGILADYGAEMFLPDDIVKRIVACAHWGKIRDVEQLFRETHWSRPYVDKYGQEILSLIAATWPVEVVDTSLVPSKTERRCGTCHAVGHNKANRTKCPQYYTKGPGASSKENVPSASSRTPSVPLPIPRLPTTPRPAIGITTSPFSGSSSTPTTSSIFSFSFSPYSYPQTPTAASTHYSNSPLASTTYNFLNFTPTQPHPEF